MFIQLVVYIRKVHYGYKAHKINHFNVLLLHFAHFSLYVPNNFMCP